MFPGAASDIELRSPFNHDHAISQPELLPDKFSALMRLFVIWTHRGASQNNPEDASRGGQADD